LSAAFSPARSNWRLATLLGLVCVLVLSGCRHRSAQLPPPQQLPPPAQPTYVPPPERSEAAPPERIPITPVPPGGVSADDLDYVATHQPIATQTGLATWYTAPYRGRRAANGQVFDDRALTAAHRTLPMGSLVVVTNLRTGQSSVMRIADRGPFVDGRVIDLTIASAKATGVYRVGLARVRIDVYETPKPIKTGGRWCVQIGAFHDASAALRLKAKLERQYAGANVIEFSGERSYWVRIRPEGDARGMAEYIARHVHPSEGDAFLTRLD
jgi:peptidoglycan lytic transglycosylase